MGILVGERIHGLLSVAAPLPAATLRATIDGARCLGDADPGGWDPDAFVRGLAQAHAVAPDPEALRALGNSIGPAAALWMLECGASSAEVVMPVAAFARPRR